MAFLQNEVDHASRAEEMLRCQLARARHEGNRSPKYAQQVEQQHEQAVKRHARANQRLDQIMRDGGGAFVIATEGYATPRVLAVTCESSDHPLPGKSFDPFRNPP
jgi:hypothetical protein